MSVRQFSEECPNRIDAITHGYFGDHNASNSAFAAVSQIIDHFVIHLAGYRALAAESSGRLATKSLHTEIIHNVSGMGHVRWGHGPRAAP